MKTMKKLTSMVLALMMIIVMAAPAMAAEEPDDNCTISVMNSILGGDYKLYKIFDAVSDGNGGYAYTIRNDKGVPGDTGFSVVGGYVKYDGTDLTDGDIEALKAYVTEDDLIATLPGNGGKLTFASLAYGYYLIESPQNGGAVTVDSANPEVEVYDKNITEPELISKVADEVFYAIGDTVTYTVTANTANYQGRGADAALITEYKFRDTLPGWLGDVEVVEITIGGVAYNGALPQFEDKVITIPWAEGGNSKYDNGAEVVIKYHATLQVSDVEAEPLTIASTGNTNTVYMTWNAVDAVEPFSATEGKSATIWTEALAIQKVNAVGDKLKGAQFKIHGVTVNGSDGVYTVVSDSKGTTAEGDVLDTNDEGLLIVKGLDAIEYSIEETLAPEGYNGLDGAKTIAVAGIQGETEAERTTNSTTYLAKNGDVIDEQAEDGSTVTVTIADLAATVGVVVNLNGTLLPTTGGIGTTIFYIAGSILVLGAAVILITRRRMDNK